MNPSLLLAAIFIRVQAAKLRRSPIVILCFLIIIIIIIIIIRVQAAKLRRSPIGIVSFLIIIIIPILPPWASMAAHRTVW